jgi:heme-degrading monooxygenase HmoA
MRQFGQSARCQIWVVTIYSATDADIFADNLRKRKHYLRTLRGYIQIKSPHGTAEKALN